MAPENKPPPLWQAQWRAAAWRIGVLCAALALLTGVIMTALSRMMECGKVVKLGNLVDALDQRVSAAEANRNFSRILQDVREGRSYVVTAHGRPVARIVPCEATATRQTARAALLHRLETQAAVDIGRWTRDELYQR